MTVDPEIRRLEALAKPHGKAPTEPAAWRAQALEIDQRLAAEAYAEAPDAWTEDVTIPCPGPDLHLRLYRPPSWRDGRPRPRGAYLAFFGGAFRQGSLDFPGVDRAWRARAVRADILVVGVDYALAPEYPYPTAAEQGYAALTWLADHAPSLGATAGRLAVGGMSSGGNLAAATALMARDRGGPQIDLQVLEVPALDLTGRHLNLRAGRGLGIPPVLVKLGLRGVAKAYLGPQPRAKLREPYASPLLAPDLAGLPPALILTAQHDLLRGDGEAYANRLRDAGVDTTAITYLGHTHASSFFTAALASSRHWQSTVESALAQALSPIP
ncbi:MAG: alpha/beta hydrolase [Bifidobacteriaceae bacterium]|jgi:acetyl esterase|nr:alpha/beta hydrolase [Bifidobacteriaceae bacterium]